MNRFYIAIINPLDKYVNLIDPLQLHHLRDVLRIKPKEVVGLFDSLSNEYIALVAEVKEDLVKFEIKEKKLAQKSGVELTVACAIPKNVKMDDIVDKLTQIGVACIIPLETQRVVVKLDQAKKLEKQQRWEKISLSAIKQSQRNQFVEIKPVTKFKDLIFKLGEYDLKLIPTLADNRQTLKSIFNDLGQNIKSAIVLIGPEGDFTPEEVLLAKSAGFIPVDLGPGVLRVDTAAIAVASFIKLNEID
ncbi:MAG: RsmE family RNA methyltransferase [Candidatus Omnitrophota bacterium]